MVIKTFAERKFVGIRVQADSLEEYPEKIGVAVKELTERLGEISHIVNKQVFYGLFKVNALSHEDGYWKCVEVSHFENTPNGMDEIVVATNKYASMQHVGTPAEIHATYRRLNQEISQSEYKVNHSQWTIEEYDQTRQSESIIFTDLFEPIS